MIRHWTEDDCIDRIYGIGRRDEHLEQCAECQALWERFESRRLALRVGVDGAEQRVHVPEFHGVAGPRSRVRLKLVPALAAAGVFAAALVVIHPAPNSRVPVGPPTALVSASDAQFFDEVAAIDESAEPRAARTAEALFEDREN